MKTILCFGDSNTWGHNPVDCSKLERPWPVVLGELLSECEIRVNGVCGRTTMYDDPNAAGKNGMTDFKELLKRDDFGADWLVIMLGTNDTLNFINSTAEECARSVQQFIRLWKERFPESKVLMVSPIEIKKRALTHPLFAPLYSEDSVTESKKFALFYGAAAKEEKVYFLDAAAVAQASDIDGIHMIEEEHEKLARKIAEIVG